MRVTSTVSLTWCATWGSVRQMRWQDNYETLTRLVTTKTVRITEENAVELLKDWDIICEAFDNPDAKTMLVHTVLEKMPDTYIVSASGMAGYGDSNRIQTKKITDHFYICGDQTKNACPGRGLMAPRVAICAAHEANLIVELLVDVLK